jgi:hypothetical protein
LSDETIECRPQPFERFNLAVNEVELSLRDGPYFVAINEISVSDYQELLNFPEAESEELGVLDKEDSVNISFAVNSIP